MALIEVDHVTKQYVKVAKIGVVKKKRTLFTAVDDISFAIEAGEKVGIVGLNGSGKSTLIKMMLGILRADDGTLATFSGDPTKYRQQNAQRIGIVFGQRSQLRWDLPVYDTFLLNKEIYRISKKDFLARVKHLTSLLDAKDFLQQPVRTLSLGQRMKAEVMASLLHDPELIILDEPTIGLDVVTKNKIVKFLQQVEGKTLLYTSHDLEDVEKICSRILILDHGKLLTDISAQALAKIATPSQIEFSLVDSANLPAALADVGVQTLPNGNFRVAGLSSKEVQDFMRRLIATTELASVTIANKRLEYIISSGLTTGGGQ